ncbi:OCIA domain-containing protein 1 isoform X2 [Aquarana catesbeiana]|uniref:OCIA domain-containing protein 1 isoform X2 n=1 Tax=Aquarana catesbeiana TaxID=8400 RepID=UPI003CCA34FE
MSAPQEEYSQPDGQLFPSQHLAWLPHKSSFPKESLQHLQDLVHFLKLHVFALSLWLFFVCFKVAGFMGYMAGKVSYINVCKEKLMKLQNSPLGEKLRQEKNAKARNMPSPERNAGYSYDNIATSPSSPPVPEPPSSKLNPSAADVPFSASMSESSTTGITDHLAQEPEYYDEKQAKAAPVTYEELRNRNRGAYDVLKPQTPERPIQSRAPKIDVKKNQYGDVWEE